MEVYQHAFEEYGLELALNAKLKGTADNPRELADKVLRWAEPLPPLLEGWGDQRMHTLNYNKMGRGTGNRDTPFAYTMVKGESWWWWK